MTRTHGSVRRIAAMFGGFVALAAFALLQPLLDLLERYPEFLAAHAAGTGEVVLLLAFVGLGVPLVCLLAVLAAETVGDRVGRAVHGLVLGLLAALALASPLARLLPGTAAAAAALALGAAFALVHHRWAALRRTLPAFALAAVGFVAVFACSPGVRSVLRSAAAPTVAVAADGGRDVPVVLVIFDEFPVTSLLAADGSIDAGLFPNFAAFAADATWYPDATTVSGATLQAVPAILAGVLPAWDRQPTAAAYPRSVFTLLGGSHRLVVDEAQTSLCPDALTGWSRARDRRGQLLRDAAIVTLHAVLPAGLDRSLPPVDTRWSGFGEPDGTDAAVTRTGRFRDWIGKLTGGGRPLLAVVHALLPHNPYRLTPDGRIYQWREREDVDEDGRWPADPAVVRGAYRRHLLQVACVDGLLGETLERLRREGIFDRALIIVTADHGCAFAPGEHHRRLDDGNLADLMAVPLLVRYPGGAHRGIDRRLAQTVDVLPTVMDVLGLQPGWELDGRSLLDPAGGGRTTLDFLDKDRENHLVVDPAELAGRAASLERKLAWFGQPRRPWDLVAVGPNGDLVGRPLSRLSVAAGRFAARLDHRMRALAVDTASAFVPAQFSGTCQVDSGAPSASLALAVNGVVAGVGRPRRPADDAGDWSWRILVDPARLRPGTNALALFRVVGAGPERHLVRVGAWGASLIGVDLGARPLPTVLERGFYKPEDWSGTPFRWTDGHAELDVPLGPDDRPRRLTCRLVSTGPGGTRLTLRVDGAVVAERDLPRGSWTGTVDLPVSAGRDSLAVEIDSGTFSPGGADPRVLGVGLAGIVLE